jgi:hypothetical protein
MIQAFFNARKQGDDFRGLNSSIEGRTSDRIIQGIPEFLREAGRDYGILKKPSLYRFPSPIGDGTDEIAEAEGQYHLVRSSDYKVVSEHSVTGQYDPLCLVDIGAEMQPFADQGWATPDGVYDRKGSTEILTLRLDGGQLEEMPDGEYLHYLCIVNPHGKGKAQGKIISWRVVCANTFARAVSASYSFAISHRVATDTQGMTKQRFSDAVKRWEDAKIQIRKLSERIEKLSAVKLSASDAEKLADDLLDIRADDEKASTNKQNKKDAILSSFNNPKLGTFGANAWDFMNAVTYLTSNGPGSKVQGVDRVVRNIEPNGTGFKLESEALSLVETL